MCSLEEFDRFEKNHMGTMTSAHSDQLGKYEEPELIIDNLIEDHEEGDTMKSNDFKYAYFLKLIKNQINDLVYKDQEIGYNILLIGQKEDDP